MSELTPEQQAELALVRAIADSLRRRMPDLNDRTLGRVAFHIADLLNGVAMVLTSDSGAVVPTRTGPARTPGTPPTGTPAYPATPRPQPYDVTEPMPRATDRPPARYGTAWGTGATTYRTGEAQPGRTSGEFPAQPVGPIPGAAPLWSAPDDTTTQLPAIQATGEIPMVPPDAYPAGRRPATGDHPAVRRTTGDYPAVRRTTGEYPAARPATGDHPAVRPTTGDYPAVRRTTGEYPAARPATGDQPALRRPGEPAAQRPGRPRIRFPSAERRTEPPRPALPPSEPADGDYLTEAPKGPWVAEFFQLDGTPLEEAQWAERDQALRGIAGRIRWLAFDGTEVTVRLRGPGGIDMDHEAVLAAIERMRRG